MREGPTYFSFTDVCKSEVVVVAVAMDILEQLLVAQGVGASVGERKLNLVIIHKMLK